MKLFFFLIILIFLGSCSFDNKSGIWNNENSVTSKDDNIFQDFKKISSYNEQFNKIIPINPTFNFRIKEPYQNLSWHDVLFDKHNNVKNLKYNNSNELIFKSKRLTKHRTNDQALFDENNYILNDEQGNIIVYSINEC